MEQIGEIETLKIPEDILTFETDLVKKFQNSIKKNK